MPMQIEEEVGRVKAEGEYYCCIEVLSLSV